MHDAGMKVRPLEYAVMVGASYIIEFIINNPPYRIRMDVLQYGEVLYKNFDGYVVNEIDYRLTHGGESILERLVHRNPKEASEILNLEPFRSIVADRWRIMRRWYRLYVLLYVLYIIMYTVCALDRNLTSTTIAGMYDGTWGRLKFVMECFTILFLFLAFYGELFDAISIGSFILPDPRLRHGFVRIINWSFIFCNISYYVMRFSFNENEDIALSFSLMLGWLNIINYMTAIKATAMFPLMLHNLWVNDIWR